jgi:hypothetical protein
MGDFVTRYALLYGGLIIAIEFIVAMKHERQGLITQMENMERRLHHMSQMQHETMRQLEQMREYQTMNGQGQTPPSTQSFPVIEELDSPERMNQMATPPDSK